MAKIVLSKNRVIEVSADEAVRVESEWKNPVVKQITIGNNTYRRAEIASVYKGSPSSKVYDLANEIDKAAIREFESILLANHDKILLHPIEWYGDRFLCIRTSSRIDAKKYNGYVLNEMLGLAHPADVQYAIEYGAFHKMPDGKWAVSDYGIGKDHDLSRYTEFMAKWKALGDLNAKRSYAESKQSAAVDALMDSAHDSFDEMPSDSEIDAALEL
jgi:hypothetical protein